jgi:hypothetical protein
MNIEKEVIAVWFSCGAASAVAAKKTIEKYGKTHTVRVLNNPIMEEDEDNRRFLMDVERWLGVDIEIVLNPKFTSASCVEVWDKRNFMSSIHGAPCTFELKKKARQFWENNNRVDHTVLGFTSEEVGRHEKFERTERKLLPVLINEGTSKGECYHILKEAGVKLPRVYDMGYPNANCIGCVKATSPTYWNHVRKMHPEVFEYRAAQSERIGAKLVRVKNVRIQLRDLDPEAKGNAMKDMDFECGIFCEERKQIA